MTTSNDKISYDLLIYLLAFSLASIRMCDADHEMTSNLLET